MALNNIGFDILLVNIVVTYYTAIKNFINLLFALALRNYNNFI